MTLTTRPWLLAVPLAVLGAAAFLGRLQTAPAAAAETGFLGLLAAATLACLAQAGAPGARITPALGCVTVLALWALPAGEVRGAAVVALLVAGVAAAVPEVLRRPAPPAVIALAIALQLLFCCDRLIGREVDGPLLLELVLLPALGALALLEIGRVAGRGVWAGAGSLMVLGGGVSPPPVVAAALLAAALARPSRPGPAARPDAARPDGPPPAWRAPLWAAVAVATAGISGTWSELLWALPAALACGSRPSAPATPGAPDPGALRGLGWAAAGAALAIALTLGLGGRQWSGAVAAWVWLPLLAPGAAHCRRSWRAAAAVAALAALPALTVLPPRAALAAPLLLSSAAAARSGAAGTLQGLWSGALLALGAAAAGYPWLREQPAEPALAILGLDASWLSALAVVVAFWILAGPAAALARGTRRLSPAQLGGALLVLAALAAALPAGTRALESPVVLTASDSRLARELEPLDGVRAAIVDSFLSNSLELEPETVVARVRILGPGGAAEERSLRFGRETSEWAARRPGLSLPPGPSAWITWVAADGTYAAQRYRAVLSLPQPRTVRRLEIVRSPALPDAVEVTITHLELR